ncbi:MAG: hypothetical protein DCC58_11330 [Chloroflexi bacterium]|nr:MAG: hypothetical protein DCC58_11330 [Chloroflexota bacterium]
MNSGKTIGYILIAGALSVGLIATAWLGSGLLDDQSNLRLSGAILGGAVILIAIVLPMLAAGIFALNKGRTEERAMAHVGRQRKMLGIIEAAGQITIADLALQMQGTRDSVRADLYDLVSKGLFAGYVDWDRGILYARQASELRGRDTCPNCGGQIQISGKGMLRCPYCGAEIFLP